MIKKGFVPLTYDAIFKPFFSQDFYLKMFIEDVLKVKIKRLEYIDTLMAKEYDENKECRLDLLVLLEDNTYINVEMQKNDTGDIIRRSQYYLNRIITRSLKQGDSYFEIKKYVAINIINYNDSRFPKLHHVCGICDLETKNAVSDVEEIHIISLKSNIINDKRLIGWKEIFNEKDGWDMRKYKGKKLEKAVKELKRLSSDEEVMSLYDQEMKEKIDRSLLRDLMLKKEIEQKEKEAALNFYKNGASKDLICKSLNISLNKLNTILKEAK